MLKNRGERFMYMPNCIARVIYADAAFASEAIFNYLVIGTLVISYSPRFLLFKL